MVRRRVNELLRKAGFRARLVLAAVSGGKDSVAMLDVMNWLSSKLGFEITAIHVNLGIPGYSEHAERVAVNACREIGVSCIVARARDVLGYDTGCIARMVASGAEKRPICALCGVIKRRVVEEYAELLGADAIATGHTLSDVVGFALANAISGYERPFGVIERGRYTRVRPLARLAETDTLNYVVARRLPFTETPCPYKPRSHPFEKPRYLILSALQDVPALLEKLVGLKGVAALPEVGGECVYCGSPSRQEYCTACRLRSEAWRYCISSRNTR